MIPKSGNRFSKKIMRNVKSSRQHFLALVDARVECGANVAKEIVFRRVDHRQQFAPSTSRDDRT